MEISELHALCGKAVKVWGVELGSSIASNVAVADVVHQNKDDGWFFAISESC